METHYFKATSIKSNKSTIVSNFTMSNKTTTTLTRLQPHLPEQLREPRRHMRENYSKMEMFRVVKAS